MLSKKNNVVNGVGNSHPHWESALLYGKSLYLIRGRGGVGGIFPVPFSVKHGGEFYSILTEKISPIGVLVRKFLLSLFSILK